ncbi:transposase [Comamonas jiangduensis]|mgnify:FL=1|jgi:transposase-like protein|uniref:Transposase n=3 Tax=cellular organisms TaxID=131567 RepID=A0A6G8IKF0_9BURK|nr:MULTISPECIES: transposase [Comamonadaceae]MBP8269686.1 transposase [Aeromonas sp.]MDH0365242.1 transposase [Comamonas aquatica]MDH1764959.1 transposase [Comamonas aquatica]MDH1766349.1 transposase [Comamonas aquatica]MDH1767635.1 transposase [Comamonas aquatica]
MEQISNEGRPRRREYSKDFKAEVLAKCRQPGASVGGVALAHGLHSNMVHRWIREAGAAYRAPLGMPGSQIAQAMQPRFTPVPLDLLSPAVPQAPAGSADQTAPTAPRPVELQLRRGDLIVSVQCPLEHCGTLLREVLR